MPWWLVAPALAGSLDAEVALDVFTSSSKNDAPGSGPEETLSATELGTRVRLTAREMDDRLAFRIDYRGRQPFAGNIRNDALHLVYRFELRYALIERKLDVGIGRFVAPTALFLPLDGASLTWRNERFEAGVFGGRRAITTSRRNLLPGEMLPGVGAFGRFVTKKADAQATIAWAEDMATIGGGDETIEEPVGGMSALVQGTGRPTDHVAFGARLGLVQQATYALGPTWTEATVEATALGLFNALGWASVRPRDWLRVDVDALHQEVQQYSVGTVEGGELVADLQEPRFTDLRLRAQVGPPKIGWLRPMLRYRVRPNRTEIRAGAQLDVNELGIPGAYLMVRGTVDDIGGDTQKDDVGSRDRAFGAASLGYRDHGLDAQVGASYVERAATPVSGRRIDPGDPGAPASSEDLQPFTLEADPILYVRGFYSGKRWFAGADLEKSMNDAEIRAVVQIGVLAEVGW